MAATGSPGAGGSNELFAEPATALPLISQGAAVGSKAATAGATHAASALPPSAAATPFDAAVQAAVMALHEQDAAASMTSATSSTTHAAGADASVASVVSEEGQSAQSLTRVGEQVSSSGLYNGYASAMPLAASVPSTGGGPPGGGGGSPPVADLMRPTVAPPAPPSTPPATPGSGSPGSGAPAHQAMPVPSSAPTPAVVAPASTGVAAPSVTAPAPTAGRGTIQMLGGPHGLGPAPQAPGLPIPLDPGPPVPQPRPHDPRLRHLPPPSWTRPPPSENSNKAQEQYKELIKDIEAHNSWRPDSGDPTAVADYNSEANWLNTWKTQLEGQLNSWDAQYTPSSSPAVDANTPPWTGPEPPQTSHPRNGPNVQQQTAGTPGQWNEALNHPQPNTEYVVNGGKYIYYTDENGLTRVIEINLNDPVSPGPRTSFDPPGMSLGDHAGHGVPKRLGGPGELINLTGQDAHVNLSPVKIIENEWWRIYQTTGHLDAEIEIVRDTIGRPLKYIYEWQDISGEWQMREILN